MHVYSCLVRFGRFARTLSRFVEETAKWIAQEENDSTAGGGGGGGKTMVFQFLVRIDVFISPSRQLVLP